MVAVCQSLFVCLSREDLHHFQTRWQQTVVEAVMILLRGRLTSSHLLDRVCCCASVLEVYSLPISSGVCCRSALWRTTTARLRAKVNVLPTHSSSCLWTVSLHCASLYWWLAYKGVSQCTSHHCISTRMAHFPTSSAAGVSTKHSSLSAFQCRSVDHVDVSFIALSLFQHSLTACHHSILYICLSASITLVTNCRVHSRVHISMENYYVLFLLAIDIATSS